MFKNHLLGTEKQSNKTFRAATLQIPENDKASYLFKCLHKASKQNENQTDREVYEKVDRCTPDSCVHNSFSKMLKIAHGRE